MSAIPLPNPEAGRRQQFLHAQNCFLEAASDALAEACAMAQGQVRNLGIIDQAVLGRMKRYGRAKVAAHSRQSLEDFDAWLDAAGNRLGKSVSEHRGDAINAVWMFLEGMSPEDYADSVAGELEQMESDDEPCIVGDDDSDPD